MNDVLSNLIAASDQLTAIQLALEKAQAELRELIAAHQGDSP